MQIYYPCAFQRKGNRRDREESPPKICRHRSFFLIHVQDNLQTNAQTLTSFEPGRTGHPILRRSLGGQEETGIFTVSTSDNVRKLCQLE